MSSGGGGGGSLTSPTRRTSKTTASSSSTAVTPSTTKGSEYTVYQSSSSATFFDWQDLLVFCVCLIHIFVCPYTKVEESFSLQAIHDILYHGRDLGKYDHFEFPGVVPRTFIGPMVVAAVASPFNFIFKVLAIPKLYSLYLVRIVLGLLLTLSFGFFRKAAEKSFGVGAALSIIFCCQFHVMFYMSRTLPNTFALALVLIGLGFWLRRVDTENWWKGMILVFTFTIAVYRSEVVLLFVPILLQTLLSRQVGFFDVIKCGLASSFFSLAVTIAIDSLMWQRWIWPEFEVFWYNTYRNQSHKWGVFPFYWYWTSALPRALMGALPLSLLGVLLDRRVRPFLIPAVVFVFLYSFLPHKELRFIFYALPLFNLSAAVTISRLYKRYYKDEEQEHNTTKETRQRQPIYYRILFLLAVFLLVTTALASIFSLMVSSYNYPGGHALKALHDIENPTHTQNEYYVHIDVLSAMTGVSRFGELYSSLPNWKYSKAEDISDYQEFTHLLTSNRTITQTHEIIAEIRGLDRINLSKSFWQQPIITSTQIYVMKRKTTNTTL